MQPLSIIYLYQNCGLYLRAACINYFSSYLRLVFEGGLYLKVASIRENTVCDALRDLVTVQFKKREKHPWRIVTFSKVAGF